MSTSAEIKAYAKINHILNVYGKRPDGFHEVETLMQAVELSDSVRVSWDQLGTASSGEGGAYGSDLTLTLDCGDSGLSCGSDNLAYRAAELMHSLFHSNVTERIDIEIEKRIPVAAGLAGGSADGAAVITGLALLWGLIPQELEDRRQALLSLLQPSDDGGDPDEEIAVSAGRDAFAMKALLVAAAQLGSDVPFSFAAQNGVSAAIGRGRGTELEAAAGRSADAVLFTPAVPVPTGRVYALFDSGEPAAPGSCEGFLSAGSLKEAAGFAANMLAPAAEAICPAVSDVREIMREALPEAALVQLSGSGPTVFALFEPGTAPSEGELRERLKKLPEGSLNRTAAV